MEDRSPVRVVLARKVAALEATRLAASAREHPLWIFCEQDAKAQALEAAGTRIFATSLVGGELWLPAVMEAMVAAGVTRLLVEGGPATWRAFAQAGLVDEAVLFMARAGVGAPVSAEAAYEAMASYLPGAELQLYEQRTIGGDDRIVFRRPWRGLSFDTR
jgi:diaminohydroxyphosphoribosylaminopyrimidine deaminase/5-amino-6-(5-phosphoribosylamino)uracil reductase